MLEESEGINDGIKNLLCQLGQSDSVIRARLNDQRLMKLAEYSATKGYTKMVVVETELQNSFNEFKRLVLGGEFTLKALEDDIYSRWGVQEPQRGDSKNEQTKQNPIGFCMPNIDVVEIDENSPDNH